MQKTSKEEINFLYQIRLLHEFIHEYKEKAIK